MVKHSSRSAGGKARAEALTPERRTEIAREAAQKRWAGVERVPKPQVTSLRLPPAQLPVVDAWAAKYGTTRQAAIVNLIWKGLEFFADRPPAPAKAAKPAREKPGDALRYVESADVPKDEVHIRDAKGVTHKIVNVGVPFGPVKRDYGAALKKR